MSDRIQSLGLLKEVGETGTIQETVKRFDTPARPAFGWLCTYVPEEVIHAAGLLPIRVTGHGASGKSATAYLHATTCSFVLGCLDQGLAGEYDFLQGLVAVNTCDPVRRLFDVWQIYLKTPFTHILSVPRKLSPNAHDFFRKEVIKFQRALEGFLGRRISGDALSESIRVYNRSRTLLRRLYELRDAPQPRVFASEAMKILKASMVMPREAFNDLLEKALDEISSRPPLPRVRARLLVCGSLVDDPAFFEMIEGLGGVVVADELCTGTRYFWDRVSEEGDPVTSLADRYLTHAPCARMRPSHHRFDHIRHLAQEHRVDGAISQSLKFCDIYGHSKPRLEEELRELGIPVLDLDLEYDLSGIGQMRTRMQSFLEMIEGRQR